MSRKTNDTVSCPECNELICFERWESINSSLNPEVKKSLISGTFGQVICPKCGTKAYLEYNFLYHDMKDKYMICVNDDYTEVLGKHERIKGYRYRRVESIRELAEKIFIFDCRLNDIVVEIMKETIKELLHIKDKLFFFKVEEGEFIFYMSEANKFFSIKPDLYYDILKTCNDADLEEKYEFMKV